MTKIDAWNNQSQSEFWWNFCGHKILNRALFKIASISKYCERSRFLWRNNNESKIRGIKIPRMITGHDKNIDCSAFHQHWWSNIHWKQSSRSLTWIKHPNDWKDIAQTGYRGLVWKFSDAISRNWEISSLVCPQILCIPNHEKTKTTRVSTKKTFI